MVLSFKKLQAQLKYKRKMLDAIILNPFLITDKSYTIKKVKLKLLLLKNAKQNVKMNPGARTSSLEVLQATSVC